ncbi:hypothetical protein [Izhakiella capsodis]|uniref:hypothetical protein n=1 Tax=Izhakiella capsodis TaxID=1367852 RepID=UPI001160D112|nr:hypothetical protein [Izhakiella capsodis]
MTIKITNFGDFSCSCDGKICSLTDGGTGDTYLNFSFQNTSPNSYYAPIVNIYDGKKIVAQKAESDISASVNASVDVVDKIDVPIGISNGNYTATRNITTNASGGGMLVFTPVGESNFQLKDADSVMNYTITPVNDPSKEVGVNKETENESYNINFNPGNMKLTPGIYSGTLTVLLKVS